MRMRTGHFRWDRGGFAQAQRWMAHSRKEAIGRFSPMSTALYDGRLDCGILLGALTKRFLRRRRK